MGKSLDDAAIGFLTAHTHFESSAVLGAVHSACAAAISSGDALALFSVPFREKLLSYKDGLLWIHFVHSQAASFAKPLDVPMAMDKLAQMYDIAFENSVLVHTFDDDSDDDADEGEEDAGE